jgi:recombination protein RecT
MAENQNNQMVLKKYANSLEIRERFASIVGTGNANAYIADVLLQAAQNPRLQQCEPQSIIASALNAATLRLSVNPNTGQAYLVPYKNKCTLIIGYKGLMQLALRTNQYRYINDAVLDDGVEITLDIKTGLHNFRRIRPGTKTVGYFGFFKLVNGFEKTVYMTVDEVKEHAKKYSKSWGMPDSAWTTNFDDMARKTVLRKLLKYGPMSVMNLYDDDDVSDEDENQSLTARISAELPAPEEVTPIPEEPEEPLTADEAIKQLFGEEQK